MKYKTEKQRKAATEILHAAFIRIHKLKKANLEYEILNQDEMEQAISGCINSHNGKWRKTKPDGELSRLLWDLMRFHNGTGSLYGYPWFADKLKRDKMETLALVLLAGKSNAMENWGRVLGK